MLGKCHFLISFSVSSVSGNGMDKLFIILTCRSLCILGRNVSLYLIGTVGLSCMLDILVVERVGCVVESLSSLLL